MRRIQREGVGIVLVSMGAKGILMISETEELVAVPPEIQVVNTIGAGDSAVAGFAYGWASGESLKESLAYAVAAGTATTLRPGSALCEKEDVMQLFNQVKVSPI